MTRVLVLWCTLNVYEILAVGLACYLIRCRQQLRDGMMLLLIEVLLLVDSTNLLNEALALRFHIGLWVNIGALGLAACKAAAVIWALKLRYSKRELAAAALGYAGMLAVPVLLAALNRRGRAMDLPVHGGWWIAALLPVAVALLLPRGGRERSGIEKVIGGAVLVGPWASLLVRVTAAPWIYGEEFQLANFAPLFVGCAAVLLWRGAGRLTPGRLHLALVGGGTLAVVTTLFSGADLIVPIPGAGGLMYSPFRAVLLALSLLYFWAALIGAGLRYAPAAAASFLAGCSGHTVGAMWNNCGRILEKFAPESRTGWGVVALAGAFLFLVAGGAVSLLKKRAEPEAESSAQGN
jgi:hypothetical protein